MGKRKIFISTEEFVEFNSNIDLLAFIRKVNPDQITVEHIFNDTTVLFRIVFTDYVLDKTIEETSDIEITDHELKNHVTIFLCDINRIEVINRPFHKKEITFRIYSGDQE